MSTIPCICTAPAFEPFHVYKAPPTGEVKFARVAEHGYRRELLRCRTCGHVVSRHEMDLSALYSGEYVDATYGDADGVRRTFERIIALPPERSDNTGRVARILEFAGKADRKRTVMDVGSGLCVFLHRMKEAGWDCTAVDPDARNARHAREVVGVNAVNSDYRKLDEVGKFDLVTFNKVLEHVENPIEMLAMTRRHLGADGVVYVELPDTEAWSEGPGREEFFIDHLHVFSMASIVLLAERAGFVSVAVERLREPSTKFTLRAFLRPRLGRKEQ